MDIEKLKETITCSICMEVATLPVHPTCCENSKSLPPACMICVRSYLGLNNHWRNRAYQKKSWNGCGCTIDPRSRNRTYTHTTQLDTIRNLLGPSKCPHQECGIECSTTAELRRHLNGTCKSTDTIKNCGYAMTRCKHCDFFGVRHIVEGNHYREHHEVIVCPICVCNVRMFAAKEHYENHMRSLEVLKTELIHKGIINDDDES